MRLANPPTPLTFLRKKWIVLVLVFIAFAWAIITSQILFPFYSNNHDEAVYILQAETLLEGKLFLPSNRFSDFFASLFLIDLGDKIIFKYTPVQATFLALGKLLLGSMRATLGFIAAGNVALIYAVSRELFPQEPFAALVATFFFLLSPFFLIQSTTFLSYSTALLLHLMFAFFLTRGYRLKIPALYFCSGVALGVAFFNRPYDAVLFSIPFALYFLNLGRKGFNQHIKLAIWVIVGFAPIFGLVLAYNTYLTENPFQLPFSLSDPLDTIGFGLKRMQKFENPQLYNLSIAFEALRHNLLELNFWVFGGTVLFGLALLYIFTKRMYRQDILLLLLFFIFPLGYVFFWGSYNSSLWGGIKYLGPFYYLPVLFPLSLLGALGLVMIWRHYPFATITLVIIMLFINIGLLYKHLSLNYYYTLENQRIYRPFVEQKLDKALIFIPPVYGPQLLHPFAYLGNSPNLDGPILYAVDKGSKNFILLDAYPERTIYRFEYHGPYTEEPYDNPETTLIRLKRLQVNCFTQRLHIINPTDSPYVYAEVLNAGQSETYLLDDSSKQGRTYEIEWNITSEKIWLKGIFKEHISSITTLLPNQDLVVAVSFSDSPDRATQNIFQRNFIFQLTPKKQLDILLPPEEWQNPFWPVSEWLMKDIDPVMKDR